MWLHRIITPYSMSERTGEESPQDAVLLYLQWLFTSISVPSLTNMLQYILYTYTYILMPSMSLSFLPFAYLCISSSFPCREKFKFKTACNPHNLLLDQQLSPNILLFFLFMALTSVLKHHTTWKNLVSRSFWSGQH